MTQEEQSRHLEARQTLAIQFVSAPHKFKVCAQCRSIAKVTASVCPICRAYRWHVDAESVIATAELIGNNPFPVTSGTVPRI